MDLETLLRAMLDIVDGALALFADRRRARLGLVVHPRQVHGESGSTPGLAVDRDMIPVLRHDPVHGMGGLFMAMIAPGAPPRPTLSPIGGEGIDTAPSPSSTKRVGVRVAQVFRHNPSQGELWHCWT